MQAAQQVLDGIEDSTEMTGSDKPANHTLISAPPACRQHRTAPEPLTRGTDIPPENVKRLHVLTDQGMYTDLGQARLLSFQPQHIPVETLVCGCEELDLAH